MEILEVDELDTRDPRYFQKRNEAARVALEHLTVEDRALVDVEMEKRRMEGHPEHIQRL